MLADDGVPIADAPDDEGSEAPYQSYNFAPGYYGVVCRADATGSSVQFKHKDAHIPENEIRQRGATSSKDRDAIAVKYKLQSMKWGIVPSWSKQNLTSTRKAINCRDDSLKAPGGMWQSMKTRKRCIVVAQGFFEWLNVSGKKKNPYFIKPRDGRLMCFAGLWDSIQHEVVTTSSNQQLRFLHDRMPVIFDAGSKDFRQWLHPSQDQWTNDLQSLLKPYEGELEIYPVNRNVGKVGCSSPSFIMPLSDNDEGHDIAHFFPRTPQNPVTEKSEGSGEVKKHESDDGQHITVPNAERNSSKRTEAPRKRKIDSSYNPPPKKTHVEPGPPGVRKITDFFS
ncbi:hypothetical protein ACHAQJ_010756 [Trichoderma viride]